MTELQLPMALEALPESIRKFCNPNAPAAAKMMAARGTIPLQGDLLVTVLTQLSADPAAEIANQAADTIKNLPEAVMGAALNANLLPPILGKLAQLLLTRTDYLERIVTHANVADETVANIARHAVESVCERIALNEERVLRHPDIVTALYHNPAARMSTLDRLLDLLCRNQKTIAGIPESHWTEVEARINGPQSNVEEDTKAIDDIFRQVAADEQGDEEAVVLDETIDTGERIKEKHVPLLKQLSVMKIGQRIRMATVGNATVRAILVRDTNKQVSAAAASSPKTSESEALALARSRQVSEDVLRFVGSKREWLSSYEIKKALVFNPKTPIQIAIRFVDHMRSADLKALSKSKNVAAPIKTTANQRMQQRSGA